MNFHSDGRRLSEGGVYDFSAGGDDVALLFCCFVSFGCVVGFDWLVGRSVGLIGWLVDWLVASVGWLISELVWSVGWLIDWFVVCSCVWLFG